MRMVDAIIALSKVKDGDAICLSPEDWMKLWAALSADQRFVCGEAGFKSMFFDNKYIAQVDGSLLNDDGYAVMSGDALEFNIKRGE